MQAHVIMILDPSNNRCGGPNIFGKIWSTKNPTVREKRFGRFKKASEDEMSITNLALAPEPGGTMRTPLELNGL
jgi:hypothetical protein